MAREDVPLSNRDRTQDTRRSKMRQSGAGLKRIEVFRKPKRKLRRSKIRGEGEWD